MPLTKLEQAEEYYDNAVRAKNKERFAEAATYFELSWTVSEQLRNNRDACISIREQINCLSVLFDTDNEFFGQAVKLCTKYMQLCKDNRTESNAAEHTWAKVLLDYARLLLETYPTDETMRRFVQSAYIRQSVTHVNAAIANAEQNVQRIKAYQLLAEAQLLLDNPEEMDSALSKAESLILVKSDEKFRFYLLAADLCVRCSRLQAALRFLDEAKQVPHLTSEQKRQLYIDHGMALLLNKEFRAACKSYLLARTYSTKHDDPAFLNNCILLSFHLFDVAQKLKKSESTSCVQKAKLCENAGDICSYLALSYPLFNRLSIFFYARQLSFLQEGGVSNPLELAAVYSSIAISCKECRLFDKAILSFREELKLQKELRNVSEEAEVLRHLAECSWTLDARTEVERLYSSAAEVAVDEEQIRSDIKDSRKRYHIFLKEKEPTEKICLAEQELSAGESAWDEWKSSRDIDGISNLILGDDLNETGIAQNTTVKTNRLGETRLHELAQQNRAADIAATLQQGEIDVNIRDRSTSGWTALHDAASRGHLNAVRVLASAKCIDFSLKDHVHGFTPLVSALDESHVDVANLLIDKGSKLSLDRARLCPCFVFERSLYEKQQCQYSVELTCGNECRHAKLRQRLKKLESMQAVPHVAFDCSQVDTENEDISAPSTSRQRDTRGDVALVGALSAVRKPKRHLDSIRKTSAAPSLSVSAYDDTEFVVSDNERRTKRKSSTAFSLTKAKFKRVRRDKGRGKQEHPSCQEDNSVHPGSSSVDLFESRSISPPLVSYESFLPQLNSTTLLPSHNRSAVSPTMMCDASALPSVDADDDFGSRTSLSSVEVAHEEVEAQTVGRTTSFAASYKHRCADEDTVFRKNVANWLQKADETQTLERSTETEPCSLTAYLGAFQCNTAAVRLQSIILRNQSQLTRSHWCQVAEILKTASSSITALDLSNCALSDEEITLLSQPFSLSSARAGNYAFPNLKELTLSHNENMLQNRGLYRLVSLLVNSPSLESVDLSCVSFLLPSHGALNSLCAEFLKHSKVKEFRIRDCAMQLSTLSKLVASLPFDTLEKLDISCKIDADGVSEDGDVLKVMSKCISHFPTCAMKELHISHACIQNQDCLSSLLQLLSSIQRLTVNISGCCPTFKCLRTISPRLKVAQCDCK